MAGTADAKDDVHRLRDIVVEEVSLVDRAANKRRFLVVKRSAPMQDGEDQDLDRAEDVEDADSSGDVVKAKKKPADAGNGDADQEEHSGTDEALEKARRSAAANTSDSEDTNDEAESPPKRDAGKKERKAKALALPTSIKEALLAGLTDALERLMAIANAVREAGPAEGDAALPQDVSDAMSAVSEMLSALCEGSAPEKKRKAVVEKAGARMAKDRLDRFQKALALLAEVLKELTDPKTQATEPTAGAAQKTAKKEEPAATAVTPGMSELVAGISELTRVVKRQEEELARIRQVRGVSNAIQVDGSGRRSEPAEVSWPLDMNRPINREQVKKEVSFFEE